ncbi:5-methyltetrahydropteroyltriglutamate--homocysteine methyltransferase [Fundidesulfovibrio magnetotacticus]|uniref:5-methyltetrahydropteroyltriglutamate--homocysteine methyltransferase n=2 Tax=Fundidesulfovibrio magnetotacticus TaxID=2730080 RepID=A0A6V8LKY7_9BACT|nr:5-methyltetrahydropteroyltriglutamate--homocysteine methyltransferase [Fundidesulfovibrio magnetotacticus]
MTAFTTTQVGSWPRSKRMLRALRDRRLGQIDRKAFDAAADEEVRRTVRIQEEAGLDVLVDGEHRRDNFYSFVAEKLEGVRLMSLAEMLDEMEDKSGFEEMLTTLDVPASAIRNPTCTGRLTRREPLAAGDLDFMRTLTDRPVKITLPGPYLLTRSMWVSAYTKKAYASQQEMGRDVVRLLREELEELTARGCEFVQFDEPVLTEAVMSGECGRRTFM